MNTKSVLVKTGIYIVVPFLFLAFWAFMAGQMKNEVILPGVGQVAQLFWNRPKAL